MLITMLPTTLLEIFCENWLISKVIFESMKVADDSYPGNSECKWVKATYMCEHQIDFSIFRHP